MLLKMRITKKNICIIINIKPICAHPSVHLSAWDNSNLNAESNMLDIECFEYLLNTESFTYIFLDVSIIPLKKGMASVLLQSRLQQHIGHTRQKKCQSGLIYVWRERRFIDITDAVLLVANHFALAQPDS